MSAAIALDAAWIFAAFLVIIVLAAVGLAVRRILLDRGGGTGECGLRRPAGTWRLGVAAYGADELRWDDTVGVLLTPEAVLERRTPAGRARPGGAPAGGAPAAPAGERGGVRLGWGRSVGGGCRSGGPGVAAGSTKLRRVGRPSLCSSQARSRSAT